MMVRAASCCPAFAAAPAVDWLMDKGRHEEALEYAIQGIYLTPDDDRLRYQLALIYLRAGEADKAIALAGHRADIIRARHLESYPVSGGAGTDVLASGLDADAETTLRWLEDRVDASTPVGQLARLARMAGAIGVRAPFAKLALARPEMPPEVADELRAAIDRN